MVITTRKRSCSANETSSGAPCVAKSRKQDEDEKDSAPRTSLKDLSTCGTPTATRRSRRFTDTATPGTSGTSTAEKHINLDIEESIKAARSDGSGSETVDSESKDVSRTRSGKLKECTSTVTPGIRTRGKTRNLDQQTTKKVARSEESAGSSIDTIDSSDSDVDAKRRKCVVSLRRFGTPTQSPRPRTVSACTTTTPSTPVRRSRRLSGSGIEDSSSRDSDTPSKKSFSIARILETETTRKEELNPSVLSVIEEDVENCQSKQVEGGDPRHGTETKPSLEEFQMQYEKFTLTTSTKEEAESDSQDIQPNTSIGKESVVVDDLKEANQDVPEITEAQKKSSEKVVEAENIGNESVVIEDLKEANQDVPKITEAQRKISEKVVEAEDLKSISQVTNIESSGKETVVETEEKQDNKLDLEELKPENGKVAEVTNSQESKTEQSESSESSNIKESSTKVAETCEEINVSHTTPDENGNSEKISTVNGLSSATESDKEPKVIPEIEKKIEQLRNIPKGRPISGRWWKKDKQRFSSINKDASGKKSWAKKMQLKQWRGEVLARSAAIEADKLKKKEEMKERQRINKIRREENAKKSEMVQVIKDPRKIKKMKRKQLRYLETRDTTMMK